MDAATFATLIAKYKPVREGRTFVAANTTICRLAGITTDATYREAAAGDGKTLPTTSSSSSASHRKDAGASKPKRPVVAEFWGGLTGLIKELAQDKAQGATSAARLKSQMLLEKKALAAFEDLHFSLLRQSNFEDAEGILAIVAQAVDGSKKGWSNDASKKSADHDDSSEGFATPRSSTPTREQ